jgi:hypothetical protein
MELAISVLRMLRSAARLKGNRRGALKMFE